MMLCNDAMMRDVRTTVNIDDDLLAELRTISARTRRPLGDLVDDALRAMLAERASGRTTTRVVLPTDGGSGLQPGVDLDDKEGLAELLGDNEPSRAAR